MDRSLLGHGPLIESYDTSPPEAEQPSIDIPDSWWREHLHVAAWLLVGGGAILFLRYAEPFVVPFVLSALLFYALDPLVDALQGWRVPRGAGAAVALGLVVMLAGGTAYLLRDDVIEVVEQLPDGARRLRTALRRDRTPSTLDKLRAATTEIDRTAASTAAPSAAPTGVMRVQIEEPAFRATDYLWWGSMGLAGLMSQLLMVGFLAYFLLVADDLFKRKLVRHVSGTLAGKKITVNVLEAIGSQIERFLLVQILTSAVVGVVTAGALWWLGLDNALVWGLVSGVLNSIPYFGPFIVTCGLAVLGFLQFGTAGMTLAIAGVALAITSLEGWLLTPVLIGRASQMNRVAVFAGLLFWSWMWGIWGTLLAVPMMMIVKSVCDHVEDFAPVADFLSE